MTAISARQFYPRGGRILMQGKVRERWFELCESAANELDPYAFVRIQGEIDRLLDEKKQKIAKSLPTVLCSLCSKVVELENCKTDERGRPVHEDCYVARTRTHSN